MFLGTCEDLLTPRTLGPFRDMAREEGGALGGLGGEDRDAVIDWLLREMRFSQRPAVVVVEDAHWADDASLDIVRYLARRVGGLPAMLVVSYREEELADDHPLRRITGALAGPAVLRLELEGLSDAAVAQLAVGVGLEPGPVIAAVGATPSTSARSWPPPAWRSPRRCATPSGSGSRRSPARAGPAWNGWPWSRPRRSCGWPRPCWTTWRCWSRPSGAGCWSPPSTGSGSGTSWPGGWWSSRSRPRGGSSITGGCWGRWRRLAPSRRGWSTTPSPPPTPRRWPATRPRRRPRRLGPRATVRRPPSPAWRWSGALGWTASSWPACTGWPRGSCTRSTGSARRPSMPTGRRRSGTRTAPPPWSWARRCSSRRG
jgi:hypothetical protein